MNVNGREIKFFRNVYANCLVADATPDGDITRFLREVVDNSDNYGRSQRGCAVVMAALSAGYELSEKQKDPSYHMKPLTQEEALSLSSEDFTKLFIEAYQAWIDDGKITVETAPPEGKKTVKTSQ